jgi:hypothetical protein
MIKNHESFLDGEYRSPKNPIVHTDGRADRWARQLIGTTRWNDRSVHIRFQVQVSRPPF